LVVLYRWFPSVLKAITIIRPETLLRWHRAGFRAVLAFEIWLVWRPPKDRCGTARADPADQRGKSLVGERRAFMASAQARLRGRSVERRHSGAARLGFSFCSYRPERAASHANGASFNRPDPPLGHGGPALDTRTDAKSARMPSTIPIKKFDGLPSDLVRPHQSEARHRAPDNR
jgi:hypothetical protein